MLSDIELNNYCLLALKIGVNIQKGQELHINCPIECSKMARMLAEKAYKIGASFVQINYNDELMTKINYENADTAVLEKTPKWYIDFKKQMIKNNACYIAIAADDPELLSCIDKDKLHRVSMAKGKALKGFYDAVMANEIRWCVISVPTLAWAKKVFPTSEKPIDELWALIGKTMRLDKENPLDEWKNHIAKLNSRAALLNDKNFEYLRYENSIGTNLTVGLALNHQWLAAEERAKDGVKFIANIPTEEIFTAPHRLKTEGVLKSALPLVSNGNIIDGFSLTFKKGKIVSYSAEKGYDALKSLIETDSGTHYLGEVALIGKRSPIAESKTLFFNTLFDENASCHLAIGKAYPTTVVGGEKLSKKQLTALGVNDSVEHEDFMIGTSDLKITGIGFDKTEVPIFIDGDWIV